MKNLILATLGALLLTSAELNDTPAGATPFKDHGSGKLDCSGDPEWFRIGRDHGPSGIDLVRRELCAGSGGPKWLFNPLRESLASSGDVDEYLVVYKGGQAVHVQTIGASPFAPQIELWDGAGNLIGADYAQTGDTHSAITMPPGGTVTNILHLYVSGAASAYPAYYIAWKGAP
jgi:hypothetical protein